MEKKAMSKELKDGNVIIGHHIEGDLDDKIKFFGIIAVSAILAFPSCASKLDVTNPNVLNDDQVRKLLASSDEAKVEETLKAIGSGLESFLCLTHSTLSGGFSNNYANEY